MRRIIGGLTVCVASLAGACAGERPSDAGQWTNPPRRQPPGSEPSSPSAANATPPPVAEDALASQVEQDMADLQRALEEREAARSARPTAQTHATPAPTPSSTPTGDRLPAKADAPPVLEGEGGVASANTEQFLDLTESASVTVAATTEPADKVVEPTLSAQDLQSEIAALREQLSARLEQAAKRGESGSRALLALGALETLHEGVLRDDTLADLGEEQAHALREWAAMHREAARRADAGESDAGLAAAGRLGSSRESEMFRVETATLCSKVEGFGRYQTLDSSTLLAGRAHRAIVYVEVSDFAHRATSNDRAEPGWNVELTQELSLYHDADQLLAWRRPEQTISDFSRNKRRDFFVVQIVELPATLSIGAYNLKVTMRDREAGAVAEAIIPIRVVADPALTRGQR